MTPQSVGVPDSTLVLGKHSGRHALSLRCEQLGHQFDRRELDEIYRRFVVLADKIKTVTDQHLHELIRETRGPGHRIPPTHVEAHPPAAASAAVGQNAGYFQKSVSASAAELHSSTLSLTPVSEHHGEQEDYLWGV
jgi:isopropylmalate/homocitrate/citramalate synthase